MLMTDIMLKQRSKHTVNIIFDEEANIAEEIAKNERGCRTLYKSGRA